MTWPLGRRLIVPEKSSESVDLNAICERTNMRHTHRGSNAALSPEHLHQALNDYVKRLTITPIYNYKNGKRFGP